MTRGRIQKVILKKIKIQCSNKYDTLEDSIDMEVEKIEALN